MAVIKRLTVSKAFLFCFVICLVISYGFLYFFNSDFDSSFDPKNLLGGDGFYYYQYLRELHLGFLNYLEGNTIEGSIFTDNKYFIGVALLQLPFFIVADIIDFLLGNLGYATPLKMVFSFLGSVFYASLGLHFVSKFLATFTQNKWHIYLTQSFLFAATPLLYYTAFEPLMSHVYSFSLISIFIFQIHQFKISNANIRLIFAALILGFITLLRPINIIIVFAIPFILGSYDALIQFVKKLIAKPKQLALYAVIFNAVILIQLLFYKYHYGKWFYYSYQNEGFNFLNPNFIPFLFSIKKGLFIYTPILLIAFLGLSFSKKLGTYQKITGLGFFVFLFYLLSSWWCWHYSGSFGQRPMVDFLGVLALPLLIVVDGLKGKKQYFILTICTLFLLLELAQTYQYKKYIIPPQGLTWKRYKQVFLKFNSIYRWLDFETEKPIDEEEYNLVSNKEFLNQELIHFKDSYTPKFILNKQVLKEADIILVEGIFEGTFASTKSSVVFDLQKNGNNFWSSKRVLEDLYETHKPQNFSFQYQIPKYESTFKQLEIYFLNSNKKIDSLKIETCSVKVFSKKPKI